MKAFYTNNNGLVEIQKWTSNCWIHIESPTETDKNYLLQELQVPEAFYNDIEDIDERPRIEIENGWTLIIMRIPVKSNDIKLPFHTIPVGIVFKDTVCITLSFHKTEMLTDFVTYTQRKNIDIKDNFDLVLKFPDKIYLTVLFNINPENADNPYKAVVERLLIINRLTPGKTVEAISDWHIKKMSLKKWLKKWQVDSVSMMINQEINKQYEWCSKNDFNYTNIDDEN